jgi:soluble lytic murein transglycosylase-like protein
MRSLKKIIFTLLLAVFTRATYANSVDDFIGESLKKEQELAVSWIIKETKGRVSIEKAWLIVKNAYKQSDIKGLDPQTILALIRLESNFQANARSNHGAHGYMQVIPHYHRDKIKGRDIYRTDVNIEVGSGIFQECLDKYHGNVQRATLCYSGGSKSYYHKLTVFKRSLNSMVLTRPSHEQKDVIKDFILSYKPEV